MGCAPGVDIVTLHGQNVATMASIDTARPKSGWLSCLFRLWHDTHAVDEQVAVFDLHRAETDLQFHFQHITAVVFERDQSVYKYGSSADHFRGLFTGLSRSTVTVS